MRLSVLAFGLLLPTSSGALAASDPVGEAAAAACPIVDLGSPTDGLSTITLVTPPFPCTGAVWSGWQCAVVQSTANSNGVPYRIGMRWNRVNQPCNATFTWWKGPGLFYHREDTSFAKDIQDTLDVVDGVRTIELIVLGNALQTSPRNGFPNLSAVLADALEFFDTVGLLEGVVGHYGNSAGGMMGANALAYHQLDQVLDGVVFGGSPYWSDLQLTCTDPTWANASLRDDADLWNWTEFNGTTPCASGDPNPSPTYACRSTLGEEADTVYDGVIVNVIVGQSDPFLPWIDAAAFDYFQRITAQTKNYDRPPNTGHTLMNFQPGADKVLQRIREIVAAGGGVVAVDTAPPAPAEVILASTPSPFASTTRIEFALERAAHVGLTVHDAAGRRVATLVSGSRAPGRHGSDWAGRDDRGRPVPSGVYFVRLEAGALRQTHKVVRVR